MQYCNPIYVPPKEYGIGESNLWSLMVCIFCFLPLGSSYIGRSILLVFLIFLKEMPNRPCFDPEQCQSGQLHCSGSEQTTESQKEGEPASARGQNLTSASESPAVLHRMPLCWQHGINLYLFPRVKGDSARHQSFCFTLADILFLVFFYSSQINILSSSPCPHLQGTNTESGLIPLSLRPSNPLKLQAPFHLLLYPYVQLQL